jgi:hypothetical protein
VKNAHLNETTTKRGLGRPRVSDNPAEREQHIECATLFFGKPKWPVSRIARAMDISVASVYLWVHRALSYEDHPEYGTLRRLAQGSRRRVQIPDGPNDD